MPQIHSSVKEWQKQQDAKNQAQKDNLQFKDVNQIPELIRRIVSLEQKVKDLEVSQQSLSDEMDLSLKAK